MPFSAQRSSQTGYEWLVIGGIVGLVLMVFLWSALWHRARRKRLLAAAEGLGLARVDLRASEAGYWHRTERGQRAFKLKLCAVGLLGGRAARFAEFMYMTGSGKRARSWTNAQISLECDPKWPALSIEEEGGVLSRPISQLFRKRQAFTEDAAFNKRWAVTCQDEAFARTLLTDPVRAFLMQGPSCEQWLIGEGWLTCTWRKACGERQLKQIVDRAGAFLAAAGG